MSDVPQQGPPVIVRKKYVHDMRRFDQLIARLRLWRGEDHEDAITLSRNCVIELLEGVAQLQRDRS